MRDQNLTLLTGFQAQPLAADAFASDWVVRLTPGADPVFTAATAPRPNI